MKSGTLTTLAYQQDSHHHTKTKDWRCTSCDKVLGVPREDRMHLRFSRGHEYFVGYPVMAVCRSCGTMNQSTAPSR